MKFTLVRQLLLTVCLGLLSTPYSLLAQSTVVKQVFDYYELKGLLLKHKPTVESILSLKRLKLTASRERPESTIYAYQRERDTTQILVRIRKSDGLVSEIAWAEGWSTLGSLTHDAVYDGFTPVAGNSRYYNRFQKIALFVNYKLAEDKIVPCILRSVE
ncbi:hypothetical protein GCM10027190_04410 [Spirosoma areae]